MILSNVEILNGIKNAAFKIDSLAGTDPTSAPFNTSAVDLRLGSQIQVPKSTAAAFDLRKSGIALLLSQICEKRTISEEQPYSLPPNKFILGQTLESVDFPIRPGLPCHSARVEGKSNSPFSLAAGELLQTFSVFLLSGSF